MILLSTHNYFIFVFRNINFKIVMSRDACSMEVDRIREDLSRLYKADSKRQTHLDHKKQSGKQYVSCY